MQPQPLIARRHLFVTGTLRYFAVRYTDLEGFDADLQMPSDDTDGLVLYTLPASELEAEQLVKKATEASVADREEVLIAIPQSIGFLRDAVLELWCLGWVEENTPELAGDGTARRELWSRRTEAEREVSEQLTSLFGGNIASPQVGVGPAPTRKGIPEAAYGIITDNRHRLPQEGGLMHIFRQSATLFTTQRQSFVMNSSIDDKSPHKRHPQGKNSSQGCLTSNNWKNWISTVIRPK